MKSHLIWSIAAFLYLIVGSLATNDELAANDELATHDQQAPPIGHIIHRPSRKLIHPLGGSARPADNTRLVVYETGFGEKRLELQFVVAPNQGGYGYIRHVPSGKYVHPLGGSRNPPNDTPLVFYRGYHAACLFKFDLKNDYIIQKTSGKIWHPKGGSGNPGNNVGVVLHSHRHDRATFFFVNKHARKISPTSYRPGNNCD